MKIYAPVKETNGIRASVRFVNGVGETNNPALVEWFRKHGYRVEESKSVVQETPEAVLDEVIDQLADNGNIEDESEFVGINELADEPLEITVTTETPDFESMNPNELRDWAKANGFGGVIKNTRNKEKLLELIRGE